MAEPELQLSRPDPKKNLAEESDSDDEDVRNRVGNVPREWYKEERHIGYDVYGKPIIRSDAGDNIDLMLRRKDDPNFARTVYDADNDKTIVLDDSELAIIHRLRHGKLPYKSSEEFDPFVEFADYWDSLKQKEALGNQQRPKRSFVPSKHEARQIVRLVHALRNGWIKPSWQIEQERKEAAEKEEAGYLLWGDDGQAVQDATAAFSRAKLPPTVPPPKPALPGHSESYNPPQEYLLSEEELQKWQELDPEDRPTSFVPRKFDSLREVPAYGEFVKERFERCLDLYLCPRARERKFKIDPESLIPKLPKLSELRPFPNQLTLEYTGHSDKIRSISLSPCGQWLASGSDDGTARVWEVATGRCFRRWDFRSETDTKAMQLAQDEKAVVDCVAWNPNPEFHLLATCVGSKIVLLVTQTASDEVMAAMEELLNKPPTPDAALPPLKDTPQAQAEAKRAATVKKQVHWGVDKAVDGTQTMPLPLPDAAARAQAAGEQAQSGQSESEQPEQPAARWSRLCVDVGKRVKSVVWHAKGDYFASFSTDSTSTSVLIHRLSKSQTQTPFAKSKGLVQAVQFHPTRPVFFVASQRHIRAYDLVKEQLIKKLLSPAKWISSIDVHPTGDHVLVGSYDRRVSWFDMELSSTPYKTLKYHKKAVRRVAFHSKYPLFASCSDDGKLHVFHGRVYSDLITNPLIVPVTALQAHQPVEDLGVLDCRFHPHQPWLFSAGADTVVRLFT